MVKKIFFCCLLTIGTMTLYSQNRLAVYKTFGGITFEYDSTSVSPRQVLSIMYMNSDAYGQFKIARRYYTAAGLCGFIGGAIVSVPIVETIAGGHPNWAIAGGGAIALLATIPLSISYRNRALDAVDTYNEQKKARIQPYYYFRGTGVSVGIRF